MIIWIHGYIFKSLINNIKQIYDGYKENNRAVGSIKSQEKVILIKQIDWSMSHGLIMKNIFIRENEKKKFLSNG